MNSPLKNQPKDCKQRQEALNPNQSFIVKAPAGSGKTAILVQRYLKLLSLVNSPEEIVAITFTNKAASEMRNRVLNVLKQTQKIHLSGNLNAINSLDDYEKFNIELALDALKQDEKKSWGMLINSDVLKIKTIDAYLNDLLAHFPFANQDQSPTEQTEFFTKIATNNALDLSSQFEDENFVLAYQRLIQYFGYSHKRLAEAIASLLAKREQWLYLIYDGVSQTNQEKYIKNISSDFLDRLKKYFLEKYKSAPRLLCLGFCVSESIKNQVKFQTVLDKHQCLFENLESENLEFIQNAIRRLVISKEGTFRVSLDSRNFLPAKPSASVCELIGLDSSVVMQTRDDLNTLLCSFKDDKKLLELFNFLTLIPTKMVDKKDLDALFLLLKKANAELEVLFNEQNRTDFSANLLKVIDALGKESSPSDLLLNLDYQIKHLLIDEFQDVSSIQVDLIKKLIAGWDKSSWDKSLFLVGDPMQSIYRFRKAEVSHFIKIEKNKRLAQLPIESIKLESNFRSFPEIVNLNNDLFSQSENNEIFGSVICDKSIAFKENHNPNSPVWSLYYAEDLNTQSAKEEKIQTQNELIDLTLNHIQSLLEKGQNDIAILTPKRSALLKQLVNKLSENSIAYSSIGVDDLFNQIEIIDLFTLAQCFFDFNDLSAWFCLFRSVYCSVCLDDLILINQKIEKQNESVFMAVSHLDLTQFSEQTQEKIGNLLHIFNHSFNQSSSLYEKMQGFHNAFDLSFYNLNQKRNINNFFDLLFQFNPTNHFEFNAFKNALKSKKISDASKSAVKIMTIHNSKGLEFDNVICFDLFNDKKNSGSELLLSEYLDNQLIVSLNDQESGGVFNWLKSIASEKEKNEKLRLHYVALTRAKKSNLIVLMNKTNNPLAKKLLEKIELKQAVSYKNQFKQKIDRRMDKLDNRLQFLAGKNQNQSQYTFQPIYYQNSSIQTKKVKSDGFVKSVPSYQWAGLSARSVGITCHYFLEQIAKMGIKNWSLEKIKDLDKEISYQYKFINGLEISTIELNMIRKVLENTTNCKKAEFIFTEYQNSANELKLSFLKEKQLKSIIIDRTFVFDNKRYIIDYKTSSHTGGNVDDFLNNEKRRYLPQMNLYAQVLSSLYPEPITLALYFPFLKELLTWEWNKNELLE